MLIPISVCFCALLSLTIASKSQHIRVFQNGNPIDLGTILSADRLKQLKNKKLIGDNVSHGLDICGDERRLEDANNVALLSSGFLNSPQYAPPVQQWGERTREQQKIYARQYPGCYIDVNVGADKMLQVTMKDYSMHTWNGELNEFCKKSYIEFSSYDMEHRLHHSRKVCCPRGAIPLQEIYLSPARTSFVRIRFVAEEPMRGRGWKIAYDLLPETAVFK